MESLILFATEHAEAAHWFFALLILLGGLNVPISEDVVMISAGALASTLSPEIAAYQYSALFFVCWFASWETYWIGRLLGPRLYDIRWFSRILTPKKIEKLHHYYERFGIWTFIIGRFIPGGVRNGLFMTAGLGRMPFKKFITRDLPACFLSTLFLFALGYFFGQHSQEVIATFHAYHRSILFFIAATLFIYAILRYLRSKQIIIDDFYRHLQ
ncbi:putative membrane protein [Waddlia chondrophila 2032/99]|uniref:Putative membrane protein n=2 Tax=Waddlia chondrophila TaxID=71667 RepID=D6YSI6_WADCW|nr:DedA family protein [Waddlia chondrophila]ADI39031.1 putative membrane protein [Waddlia chondrophila WSU 86-1044]CCB92149.1 putative membrane protein [Waddlia chondrophila 2032/99]